MQQLAAMGSIIPSLSDPTIGVIAGLGAAFFIVRKEPKWTPFWLALAGSFTAVRLAALLDQGKLAQAVAVPTIQDGAQ
jgi:hypothetical protein